MYCDNRETSWTSFGGQHKVYRHCREQCRKIPNFTVRINDYKNDWTLGVDEFEIRKFNDSFPNAEKYSNARVCQMES